MARRRVSAVLPVFRNRPQLPELYRRLTDVLESQADGHELVFVDDAGGDGSADWLRERREADPRVVLVQLAFNHGQHKAVIAGLSEARGDAVVVMDADLQDRPEDIPRLLAPLGAGRHVVFARRTSRHQSQGRHLTGRLFKRALRRVGGSRVPAGTGMFFAASREAVEAAVLAAGGTRGARYVPLLFDHAGATMSAVDVTKEMRDDVESAYTTWRRLRLAADAIRHAWAGRMTRPRR